MRIICSAPIESGAYDSINDNWPFDSPPDGYIQVADGVVLTCGGFGTPTIENGVMTAWTGNETAWAAWQAAHPIVETVQIDLAETVRAQNATITMMASVMSDMQSDLEALA